MSHTLDPADTLCYALSTKLNRDVAYQGTEVARDNNQIGRKNNSKGRSGLVTGLRSTFSSLERYICGGGVVPPDQQALTQTQTLTLTL